MRVDGGRIDGRVEEEDWTHADIDPERAEQITFALGELAAKLNELNETTEQTFVVETVPRIEEFGVNLIIKKKYRGKL